MRSNRLQVEIERRLAEVAENFAVGQVAAIVGTRLTVITTGGGALTIPRMSTWTPVVGDMVLLAITPAGWIALGKILP